MRLSEYLSDVSFKGTPTASARVLVQQVVLMTVAVHAAVAMPVAATALWALLVLRAYMIFHDCGHRSFFQGFKGAAWWNWIALHVSAVLCGTPTDWNVGHQLHHAHVGNLGQDEYDWGETVFHTRRQFLALPRGKRLLWRVARHPVPFFLLAPVLTWYVRMRLPIELRPERRAAYRASDKLISTAWMALRYGLAARDGILSVILLGDYLAMTVGVMLFHVQHVFEGGYVRDASQWKIRDAATAGSSRLYVPKALKFFTLGIEFHHIHHFKPQIPGYMLERVHDGAPASFDDLHTGFRDVPRLGAREVLRSLAMQCYDEDARTFVPFPVDDRPKND